MLNKNAKLIDEIIEVSEKWLGDSKTYTSPHVKCSGASTVGGKFFINIAKVSAYELIIQEIFTLDSGVSIIYRMWKFMKEDSWGVFSLDKNSRPVFIRYLTSELEELTTNIKRTSTIVDYIPFQEIEKSQDLTGDFKIPEEIQKSVGRSRTMQKIISWKGWQSPILPIALLATILIVGISTDYLIGMNTEKTIMTEYNKKFASEYNKIGLNNIEKMKNVENELNSLINQYNNALEYNRDMAFFTVLRMKEEMTKYSPSRKVAYEIIAENIKESVTFSEITYEFSRLPSSESEASNFIKNNKGLSNKPLSFAKPVFENLGFPVQVEGREIDGKGFRISKKYTSPDSEFIEIINVSNIAHITKGGHIVRDSETPGNVVAIEKGLIETAYYSERLGWTVEISHTITPEIKEVFPEIKKFTSVYAHLKDEPQYKSGETIQKEQTIGKIGNSGTNTNPSLYFELRFYTENGKYSSYIGKYDKLNPFLLAN
ncbi:MAG: M23 family metallopeptidase [Spirochaetales bacterium]|nr:M23 family metallopeptidase [Spirochaetales bacterium]